jgi:hypothetical protein
MSGWPSKNEIDTRVRAWLAEHWKTGCPLCGATTYVVSDDLMVSLPIRHGMLRPLDTFVGHPYVQAFCEHCGYMVQVSSTVLGLTGGK